MSYKFIEPNELAALISSGKANDFKVIDVRDSDFEGGNIVGALNKPSESFAPDELVKELKDVPRVIFHCALSQVRGPRAAGMYSEELQRQSTLSASASTASSSADPPTASLNPFTTPAIITPVQEVLVLRGGFTDFQSLYRKDSKLVEKFDVKLWGSYSQ